MLQAKQLDLNFSRIGASNSMMNVARHYSPRTISLLLTGIWLTATLISSVAHWHRPFSLCSGSGFAFVQDGQLTISAGGLVLPKHPANSSRSSLENALMKLFPASTRTTVESLGFQLAISIGPGNYRSAYLSIPLWLPYLILVSIPASRWAKSYRRRIFWTKPNECRKCGYNLTGNETGVCSECGAGTSRSKLSRAISPLLALMRVAPVLAFLLLASVGWNIYSSITNSKPPIVKVTRPRPVRPRKGIPTVMRCITSEMNNLEIPTAYPDPEKANIVASFEVVARQPTASSRISDMTWHAQKTTSHSQLNVPLQFSPYPPLPNGDTEGRADVNGTARCIRLPWIPGLLLTIRQT